MSHKLHKTKGIVLRAVKYGETSLIVSILTEVFGVQSYLVNGVRASSRKGNGKANLFQPAALLDLVVYHNELTNLQRIREFRWGVLYRNLFSDVRKNAVALFMVELLTRSLKEPEANEELFKFAEHALVTLDEGSEAAAANFPLFFALRLAGFLGFGVNDDYSEAMNFLDLREGIFVSARPEHPHFLEEKQAEVTSRLLRIGRYEELGEIKLNHDFRRNLLYAYETYYNLHIQNFGTMRSLPILKELLS